MLRRRRGRDFFKARGAAYQRLPDIDTELLILAEKRDGSGRMVEIQRSLGLFDDDEELDGLHCVVLDAGPTHYDAVTHWSLVENVLRLGFSAEATRTFGMQELTIQLDDLGEADVVASALRHLLDGEPPPSEFGAVET